MTARRTSRGGFTLVELIVASVIAALVAGSTVMAMSRLLALRSRASGHEQAFGRADAAAADIARDLANALRDWNLPFARVAINDSGDEGEPHDELLLLAHSARRARPGSDTPEGGDYEIQYRIAPLVSKADQPALWRRIDPAHDVALDGGGVASAAVAGVTTLALEANDGEQWFPTWDSDRDGLPHAVRVTITASSDDRRVFATARRTVAIDRVPIPIDTSATGDTGTTGPTGSTGPAGSTGTPSGGNPTPTPTPTPTPAPGGGGGGRGGGGRGGGGNGGDRGGGPPPGGGNGGGRGGGGGGQGGGGGNRAGNTGGGPPPGGGQ
jgi:prepilin-type N-terminal cleavage/methylation domain-containing protein